MQASVAGLPDTYLYVKRTKKEKIHQMAITTYNQITTKYIYIKWREIELNFPFGTTCLVCKYIYRMETLIRSVF
jgi:hypothetical protein